MKKLFVLMGVILLMGAVAFVLPLALTGWDFSLINLTKYTSNTHELTTAFNSISIDTDTDVTFVITDSDTVHIECVEKEKYPYTVNIDGGVLKISPLSARLRTRRFCESPLLYGRWSSSRRRG